MNARSALGQFLRFAALSAAVSSFPVSVATAQNLGDCGSLDNPSYGPFDYRTATAYQKQLVEIIGAHFTSSVESLQHGNTAPIGGELDYTLRAFPNHRRALLAMIRLGQREKTTKPKGAQWTVACYIERGVQFQPDDAAVRELRGIYYSMQHKYNEAITDFKSVLETEPNNANAHYNLGLAYFQVGNYVDAREEARTAKKLGFPLHGLEDMLKAKKQWSE